MRSIALTLFFGIVSTLPAGAFAQGCLELVGQWPFGPAGSVELDGTTAYLGVGSALVVAGLGGPVGFEVLGSTALPSAPASIESDGSFVFAGGLFGLRIIDARDPMRPEVVGSYDTGEPVSDLSVESSLVYLMTFATYSSITIVDVSDPSKPIEIGRTPPFHFTSMDAEGSYLYATTATFDHALRIIDVSDPENPIVAGSIDLPVGLVSLISVVGGTAVLTSGNTLLVLDVSDPTAPKEAGSIFLTGRPSDLCTHSSLVFVATSEGLEIIDVADPTDPVRLGSLNRPDGTRYAACGATYAVVSDPAGFTRVEVVDPSSPRDVGSLGTPGQIVDIVSDGAFDYVIEEDLGIRVLEVPASGDVSTVSLVEMEEARGLALSDDLLSVFSPDGLTIIDVSNPVDPVEVGRLTGFAASTGAVEGPITVMSGGDNGLTVVDTSDPSHPVMLGRLDGWVKSVALSGGYAYILYSADDVWYHYHLHVVDLSDPRFPTSIGWAGCDAPNDVVVDGHLVYASDYYKQLCVFDAADPSDPVRLSWAAGTAYDVAAMSGFAYTVGDELAAFDVRDPAAPRLVAEATIPESTRVVSSRGRLHVASPNSGLAIYRACAHPSRKGSGRRLTP